MKPEKTDATTHTKGPWTVHGPSMPNGAERSRDYYIRDSSGMMLAEAFEVVGKDTAGMYVYVDARANARLIASAPTLLAERDALFAQCEAQTRRWAKDGSVIEALVEACRAALGMCRCSLAERNSGHLIGCDAVIIESALALAGRTEPAEPDPPAND